MLWRIRKSILQKLQLGATPYATAAMRDEGHSFLIRQTHPDYKSLHERVHKTVTAINTAAAKKKSETKEHWGARKWAEFHRWAMTVDLSTPEAIAAARKWHSDWMADLSSHGCNCRPDYQNINSALPLDFSSNRGLFITTVLHHNAVNRKLGKKEWSQEEADQRWSGIE